MNIELAPAAAACGVLVAAGTLFGAAWHRAHTEGASAKEQIELRKDVEALMIEKSKSQDFCSKQTVINDQVKEMGTSHGRRLESVEGRLALSEGREQGRREGR